MAERSRPSSIRQDRTACFAWSTSLLAVAGRSQPPREWRLVLLLFPGSPRSLLEWGSIPLYLYFLLSPLAVAGRSVVSRNVERRLMMFRGPSQPRFEKQLFPPDPRTKCRSQPPCSLSPKRVVAPSSCAPVSLFPHHVIGLHFE